jgi:hypothetical protein
MSSRAAPHASQRSVAMAERISDNQCSTSSLTASDTESVGSDTPPALTTSPPPCRNLDQSYGCFNPTPPNAPLAIMRAGGGKLSDINAPKCGIWRSRSAHHSKLLTRSHCACASSRHHLNLRCRAGVWLEHNSHRTEVTYTYGPREHS